MEKRSGPGPQAAHNIDMNLVRQSRYNNILLGGHAPKMSVVIDNNNPAPGTYEPPTMANISMQKARLHT